MIKAFLLVLYPAATWDGIVQAKRGWQMIFLRYLVPLWLIGFVAEGYGLIHWGKPRGFTSQIRLFSNSEALIFEILQQILLILVVFVGAKIIKACGETFHGRNTFTQTFTVAAYGLGPLFALHIVDMFAPISGWAYWVMWGVGILLSIGTLYHGIPRVMLPDPPHAFGLYITGSVMLLMVSGLVRFLTYSYLSGKFGRMDTAIDGIIAHLPFLQSFNQMHL
jgi:hypothetical protein